MALAASIEFGIGAGLGAFVAPLDPPAAADVFAGVAGALDAQDTVDARVIEAAAAADDRPDEDEDEAALAAAAAAAAVTLVADTVEDDEDEGPPAPDLAIPNGPALTALAPNPLVLDEVIAAEGPAPLDDDAAQPPAPALAAPAAAPPVAAVEAGAAEAAVVVDAPPPAVLAVPPLAIDGADPVAVAAVPAPALDVPAAATESGDAAAGPGLADLDALAPVLTDQPAVAPEDAPPVDEEDAAPESAATAADIGPAAAPAAPDDEVPLEAAELEAAAALADPAVAPGPAPTPTPAFAEIALASPAPADTAVGPPAPALAIDAVTDAGPPAPALDGPAPDDADAAAIPAGLDVDAAVPTNDEEFAPAVPAAEAAFAPQVPGADQALAIPSDPPPALAPAPNPFAPTPPGDEPDALLLIGPALPAPLRLELAAGEDAFPPRVSEFPSFSDLAFAVPPADPVAPPSASNEDLDLGVVRDGAIGPLLDVPDLALPAPPAVSAVNFDNDMPFAPPSEAVARSLQTPAPTFPSLDDAVGALAEVAGLTATSVAAATPFPIVEDVTPSPLESEFAEETETGRALDATGRPSLTELDRDLVADPRDVLRTADALDEQTAAIPTGADIERTAADNADRRLDRGEAASGRDPEEPIRETLRTVPDSVEDAVVEQAAARAEVNAERPAEVGTDRLEDRAPVDDFRLGVLGVDRAEAQSGARAAGGGGSTLDVIIDG